MNLSESAKAFLALCWKNGEIRSIHPTFGEKYTIGEKIFKFTEEVCEELESSGRVKIVRSTKTVNITGKVGIE